MKKANFRIVVTMENHNVLFCKASNEQQLNLIKEVYLAQEDAEQLEIYVKADDNENYRLISKFSRTPQVVRRPIGFERW